MSIQTRMKSYPYSIYNTLSTNAYGETTTDYEIAGYIDISIALSNQATIDSIKHIEADYIGVTKDKDINTLMLIHYNDEYLQVKYIFPADRYNVVALVRV